MPAIMRMKVTLSIRMTRVARMSSVRPEVHTHCRSDGRQFLAREQATRAHARSAGCDWLRQNLARVRQRDTGRLARKRRVRPVQGPQEGKLEMLTRPQVQRYSVECGLRDLMIAETEVVLTFLLQLLSERGIHDRLAFKGGTCLRKMFVGSQGRFSTDLDFTGIEEHDHEEITDVMSSAAPMLIKQEDELLKPCWVCRRGPSLPCSNAGDCPVLQKCRHPGSHDAKRERATQIATTANRGAIRIVQEVNLECTYIPPPGTERAGDCDWGTGTLRPDNQYVV